MSPKISEPEREPLAYTVRQVLDLVPISRAHLYKEIRAGKVIPTKVGTRTLFTPEALHDWLTGGAERRDGQRS